MVKHTKDKGNIIKNKITFQKLLKKVWKILNWRDSHMKLGSERSDPAEPAAPELLYLSKFHPEG